MPIESIWLAVCSRLDTAMAARSQGRRARRAGAQAGSESESERE
jgi:hypothetical protein